MIYFGNDVTCPGDIVKRMVDDGVVKDYRIKNALGLDDAGYKKFLSGAMYVTEDIASKLASVTDKDSDFWENSEALYRHELMELEKARWLHGERMTDFYN